MQTMAKITFLVFVVATFTSCIAPPVPPPTWMVERPYSPSLITRTRKALELIFGTKRTVSRINSILAEGYDHGHHDKGEVATYAVFLYLDNNPDEQCMLQFLAKGKLNVIANRVILYCGRQTWVGDGTYNDYRNYPSIN